MTSVRPLFHAPWRRGAAPATDGRRTGWRAGPRPSWAVIVACGCIGSAFGLAFGVGALNRPLANGLLFYALGFLAGAALAAVVMPLRRVHRGPVHPSPPDRHRDTGTPR